MGPNIAQISKKINIKTFCSQQSLTIHQNGKDRKRKQIKFSEKEKIENKIFHIQEINSVLWNLLSYGLHKEIEALA